MAAPLAIFVDGDACPVKAEVFKVAERYRVPVTVVSNSFVMLPRNPLFSHVLVPEGPDVADDWIAERAGPGAVVVTADVPLAARCVAAGAVALGPKGKVYDEASMGMALATRNLMTDLRSAGEITSGPRPFAARDRSTFLQALDLAITRLRRAGHGT